MSEANPVWLPFVASLVASLVLTACSAGTEEASVPQVGDEDLSLGELVSRLENAEYQVTYNSSAADGAQGQMTVAVKDDKTYVAFDFDGGEAIGFGALGEGRFAGALIEDGATSYSCGDLADLFGLFSDESEGSEVCYRSESTQEENDLPSLRDFFNPVGLAEGLATVQTERDGTESIAGHQTSCFKVDTPEIQGGRVCVEHETGVPLLIEARDAEGADFSQRATELRDDVDDSVFEPPYEVKDYPEIPFSE